MKLQDQYDWVVLGDHPGALLSGCLLSHLGFSVLILPLFPSLLTGISRSGQCMDPETNFIMGLGKSGKKNGLLLECLGYLGVVTSSSKLFEQSDRVMPQILTPTARVKFALEDEPFERELERELGKSALQELRLLSALEFSEGLGTEFWRQFPVTLSEAYREKNSRWEKNHDPLRILESFLSHRSYEGPKRDRMWFHSHQTVDGLLQGKHDLANLLAGLWFAMTEVDSENPRIMELVHLMGLTRSGASFRGGVTAYRRYLLALAKQLGAQVPEQTECRRIFVENGSLIGVQIAHRGKMIAVNSGILGSSLEHVKEYLCFSGRKWFSGLKRPPRPKGWRFTLALTVHPEGIPAGMGQRAIWKEEGAPSLEIEVAEPSDYVLEKREEKFVFVRTWLPFDQRSLEVSYQRLMASRMFSQLRELFPFLEKHVVKAYPDFWHSPHSVSDQFSETYGFVSPEMIPENIRCIEGEGVGHLSGIEGFYVASGESYPSLGSFGGTVAAIESTTRFLRKHDFKNKNEQNSALSLWSFLSKH